MKEEDQVQNLCDNCIYEYGSCEADGADEKDGEVVRCGSHTPSEPDATQASPVPIIEEPEPIASVEPCLSCGKPLKVSKVNRRVRSILCDNMRCKLYREVVRTFSIPKPGFSIPKLATTKPHKHQYKRGSNTCLKCDHVRIPRKTKKK